LVGTHKGNWKEPKETKGKEPLEVSRRGTELEKGGHKVEFVGWDTEAEKEFEAEKSGPKLDPKGEKR
jgi:hypothetical protein